VYQQNAVQRRALQRDHGPGENQRRRAIPTNMHQPPGTGTSSRSGVGDRSEKEILREQSEGRSQTDDQNQRLAFLIGSGFSPGRKRSEKSAHKASMPPLKQRIIQEEHQDRFLPNFSVNHLGPTPAVCGWNDRSRRAPRRLHRLLVGKARTIEPAGLVGPVVRRHADGFVFNELPIA